VCNKIGTYLKALAAFDNGVPFYAAVPSPTIDWSIKDALADIEIEQRHGDEVAYMQGLAANGDMQNVRLIPAGSNTANPAFDVTPARLVTGIITERGVYSPADLVSSRLSKAFMGDK
jgi:methylthioribose-1-phosphate isomerase